MMLEEFSIDPLGALIKAERYLNEGSPSGFSDTNTTSAVTRPKSARRTFGLAQIAFADIAVRDFGIDGERFIDDDGIYIHPDILQLFPALDGVGSIVSDGLMVAPTASGRTVFSVEKECFVKLAYPKCLGRLVRHLNSDMILSACEVTKQLTAAVNSSKVNPAFSFLREDFGRVAYLPNGWLKQSDTSILMPDDVYELGILFREVEPYPYQQRKQMLIPFFALFSDEFDPMSQSKRLQQDRPLVVQLFEMQGKPIEQFLLQDILCPLFHTYFDALLCCGIELEAHAQNMLIAIDEGFRIKRIVCRDLESSGRDAVLMDYLGLTYSRDVKHKLNTLADKEKGQKYPQYYINHSFMFDFKLGEYIVTPLLEKLQEYKSFDCELVRHSICEFNDQFIKKLPNDFYPPDWCRYDNINWEKEMRPRQYIWSDKPKYRWVD